MWLSLPFLALFLHGYGWMFALTAASAWGRRDPGREAASLPGGGLALGS
jgi:hypothetical protein